MKKVLSAVLALVMLFSVFAGGTTAWAAGVQGDVTETPAAPEGTVFTGWFEDDACTIPYTESTGTAYARFTDKNVFQVMYQITPDANEDESDFINLRVISTVDALDYQEVGFKVSFNGGAAVDKPITKVYTSLTGYNGVEAMAYAPTVFSSESQYFFAYNCKINKTAFEKGFTFTPYFVMANGDRVDVEEKLRDFKVVTDEYFNVKLITNAEELAAFATASQSRVGGFVNWKVKLTQDIDLNEGWEATSKAAPTGENAIQWTPIGSQAYPFAGIFDGQGHTISGVYLSATALRQGLFGETASTAKLRDFRLTNSYFKSTQPRLGSVVGSFKGTAEQIYSDATVVATSNTNAIGGLFGRFDGDATVSECWYGGAVTASGCSFVGGLIGNIQQAGTVRLEHSLFSGTVSGSNQVGGLIGKATSASGGITINDCASLGSVTGSSKKNRGSMIGQSDITVPVSNTAHYVPNDDSLDNSGIGSDYSGKISSGGRVARLTSTTPAMLHGIDGLKLLYGSLTSVLAENWALKEDNVPVPVCFSEAGEAKTYTISTGEGLAALADASASNNFSGWTIKLGADIDLNEGWTADANGGTGTPTNWTPIGCEATPFAGTFDGQGKTISGLYLSASTAQQGLFGATTTDATIRDFRLENSYLTTTAARLGSIVGNFAGTAERIYSNAFVKNTSGSFSRHGGLFGAIVGATTVSECWYDGAVSSVNSVVGGLAGVVQLTAEGAVRVEHSLFSGTVYGKNGQAGGLFGYVQTASGGVTVHDCASLGTVTGGSSVGLLAGKNDITLRATNSYFADGVSTNKALVGSGSLTSNTKTVKSSSLSSALVGLGGMRPLNGNTLLVDQWRLRTGGVPVPKYFGEADNTYTITSAADLNTLATLSQTNSFSGWTFKLGADIDLNEGWTADATGGTGTTPTEWTPIGTTSVPVAGTFDGDDHTISGVYMEVNEAVNGLFRKTAATAVLMNFRLENSYLNVTTGNRVGSIVGDGYGAIYNVYSNAIINGRGWTGGLVGFATNLTMEQCQFDGTYTNTTANGSGVGGLIGYVNGGNTVIRNCLNSGVVNSESYVENNQPKVGGLVGQVASNGTLTIENCLNTGLVSTVKTYTFGRILGYNDTGCSTTVIGSYATQESCASADANGRPAALEYELVTAAGITGAAAQTAMPLLDWDNVWQTVAGELPTLRFNKASIGGNAANGEATSADTAQLSAVYAGTTLYQGDMHAHADADGKIDEATALAQWKTEMAGHDLDFVASLDHKQTSHIGNDEWDKDLFLYGTEPGTYITGLTSPTFSATKGKAHYLMLFKDRQSLLNVVQNGTFGFKYNAAKDNDSATPTSGAFDYPEFSKSGFAALAAEVKAQGGLFVFAHPYAYNYSSAAEDYFIADETALELIYTGMSTAETLQAYSTWKALLAAGHKVWVSSGTDIHGGLDTQDDHDANPRRAEKALISVYAVTDTELTDKADLVMDELVRGNFAAGSVGIKMCIGNTPMGGTVDFAGKRLVVEVSGFHKYVKDTAHKYYVRVITDQGAVYSQRISGVNDATTFALDADESYSFYRVEVVDEQGGRVISYGNPIWNE